nr:hypothetical protein [Pandoravirus massiliensis]
MRLKDGKKIKNCKRSRERGPARWVFGARSHGVPPGHAREIEKAHRRIGADKGARYPWLVRLCYGAIPSARPYRVRTLDAPRDSIYCGKSRVTVRVGVLVVKAAPPSTSL